ncbi:F-box domain containing protein [Tanacetum coccineum]
MIPKIYSAEWIRFLLMVIEWEVAKNLLHLWLSLGVRGVEKKCLRWIIPGHAGLVQRAKLLKENVFILDPDGALMSTQEYMQKVVEDVGEDANFNNGAWVRPLTCECFLVHLGAAMILANVSVFTPKPSKHYLNITKRNVVEVFRKDTVEIKEDTKNKEVRIFFDAGRVLRPLLVVQNLHKFRLLKGGSHSFQDLLDSGIVELIGPEEEEDCRTAWEACILNQAQKEKIHGLGHERRVSATDGHLILGLIV